MTSHSVQTIHVPARRTLATLKIPQATLTVGSMIMTNQGERAVEDLKPGHVIVTKDVGLQALKFIAFRDIDLKSCPAQTPVKISHQAFGLDRTIYAEPRQCFAVRHPMFKMMFGRTEVLVKCGDVTDQPGFTQVQGLSSVTYVALGFARQHILFCNGAQVEIGTTDQATARICLSAEEARLALQLLTPKPSQAKRHSFPLH